MFIFHVRNRRMGGQLVIIVKSWYISEENNCVLLAKQFQQDLCSRAFVKKTQEYPCEAVFLKLQTQATHFLLLFVPSEFGHATFPHMPLPKSFLLCWHRRWPRHYNNHPNHPTPPVPALLHTGCIHYGSRCSYPLQ